MELPKTAVCEPERLPVMVTEEKEPVALAVMAPETLRVLPSVVAPTVCKVLEPEMEPVATIDPTEAVAANVVAPDTPRVPPKIELPTICAPAELDNIPSLGL